MDVLAIAKGEEVSLDTYDGRSLAVCLEAVKAIVPAARLCTNFEIAAYIALCCRHQVDPFSRQVHLIKYNEADPITLVLDYMVYHDRAGRHPQYDGYKSGIIWNVNGTLVRGTQADYSPPGTQECPVAIQGGWAQVFRKDREHPVDVEIPFSEAVQCKRDGTPNRNWKTQPTTLMVKVAESRALRKAFAEQLGGTYTDVENVGSPEATTVAATVAPRGERKPKEAPSPEAAANKQALHELAEHVNIMICEATGGAQVDQATTGRVLVRLAARVTGESPEKFNCEEPWTVEFCAACDADLMQNGVADAWLSQEEHAHG